MDIENEVRDFLMSRRARITPTQAGLRHISGKRRVAGLRREEVAMLAGLSVEYYTRMERGNIGGASESVLGGIARALQLDEDETAHLHDLVRHVGHGTRHVPASPAPELAPSVQQVIDSMSVPAVVMTDRLDILATNDLGRALYADLFTSDAQAPNFARFAFLDPRAETFYPDLDDARSLVVSVLRSTAGREPQDETTSRLVSELSALSADFAARWSEYEVRRHTRGRKTIQHPRVGRLELTYDDFALPGAPHVSITTYTAAPGSASADALALLAVWIDTPSSRDRFVSTAGE